MTTSISASEFFSKNINRNHRQTKILGFSIKQILEESYNVKEICITQNCPQCIEFASMDLNNTHQSLSDEQVEFLQSLAFPSTNHSENGKVLGKHIALLENLKTITFYNCNNIFQMECWAGMFSEIASSKSLSSIVFVGSKFSHEYHLPSLSAMINIENVSGLTFKRCTFDPFFEDVMQQSEDYCTQWQSLSFEECVFFGKVVKHLIDEQLRMSSLSTLYYNNCRMIDGTNESSINMRLTPAVGIFPGDIISKPESCDFANATHRLKKINEAHEDLEEWKDKASNPREFTFLCTLQFWLVEKSKDASFVLSFRGSTITDMIREHKEIQKSLQEARKENDEIGIKLHENLLNCLDDVIKRDLHD